MWALTKTPITNAGLRKLLEEHKRRCRYRSDVWLLRSHLHHLNVRELLPLKGLPITTSLMIGGEAPSAVPMRRVPHNMARQLMERCPPTQGDQGSYVLHKDGDAESSSLHWVAATPRELLDASLQRNYHPRTDRLLCSMAIHPCYHHPQPTLQMINAQDTNNPYLLDDSLQHMDLSAHAPIRNEFISGLTTISAQFSYRACYWLEEDCLGSEYGIRYQRRSNCLVGAHAVAATEIIRLVHLSQLSMEEQQRLIDCAPRFVLLDGQQQVFVRLDGRWARCRAHRIRPPLLPTHVPAEALRDTGTSELVPLLWVVVNDETVFDGAAVVRRRVLHRRFFNLEQLEPL